MLTYIKSAEYLCRIKTVGNKARGREREQENRLEEREK